MGLLFLEKVNTNQSAFARKVAAIGHKYSFNPNWLMAVINNETGGTLSPSIPNGAGSGAVGLIQFMPSTAKDLGTTTSALAGMSNVEQLEWVDKYIGKTMGYFDIRKIADYDDLYFIVFFPMAIGKADSWAFPSWIYAQNKGVDVNRDGVITVADFKAFIHKQIPDDMEYLLEFMGNDTRKKALFVFITVCIGVAGTVYYLLTKKK